MKTQSSVGDSEQSPFSGNTSVSEFEALIAVSVTSICVLLHEHGCGALRAQRAHNRCVGNFVRMVKNRRGAQKKSRSSVQSLHQRSC